MKKLILALLVSLLIITGCTSKVDNYHLTSAEVIEKMEDKQSFLLYFTSKTCSACTVFKPVYEDVRKDYGQHMYALEVIDENNDNPEELKRLLSDYVGNITSTPTVLVIVDGEVVQIFVGIMKYSELENALSNYKIVK